MAEYIEKADAFNVNFRISVNIFESRRKTAEKAVKAYADEIAKIPSADVVPGSDFRDCRNELCLYCGKYKERHNGACDGCRWKERGNG